MMHASTTLSGAPFRLCFEISRAAKTRERLNKRCHGDIIASDVIDFYRYAGSFPVYLSGNFASRLRCTESFCLLTLVGSGGEEKSHIENVLFLLLLFFFFLCELLVCKFVQNAFSRKWDEQRSVSVISSFYSSSFHFFFFLFF